MLDVFQAMQSRGYPVRFEYGPTRAEATGVFDGLIIVERDHEQTDAIRPAQGSAQNPHKRLIRELACKARIYARSPLSGARVNEHEADCERYVDGFTVALEEWGAASRAGYVPITEARYLRGAEREDPEVWPGLVYLLRFRISRGVSAVDYAGAARPVAAPTAVANRTRVDLDGGDFENVPVP